MLSRAHARSAGCAAQTSEGPATSSCLSACEVLRTGDTWLYMCSPPERTRRCCAQDNWQHALQLRQAERLLAFLSAYEVHMEEQTLQCLSGSNQSSVRT